MTQEHVMKFQFLYPWIKLAGTQPHKFLLLLVITAFIVDWQSSVAMTDNTWLSAPKIFTIWPFTEKNLSTLVYMINFSRHWLLTRTATSSCLRALFGWQSTSIWLVLPGSWLALDCASILTNWRCLTETHPRKAKIPKGGTRQQKHVNHGFHKGNIQDSLKMSALYHKPSN